jgi:hypothetical protein
MTKPTLNLGCGPDTWGDVRLDVDFHTQTGAQSKLNIMADAHFLPFVDKAFGRVRCWHVLEHVAKPAQVITEIKRVGDSANIRFPIDDGFKREFLRNLIGLASYKGWRVGLRGMHLAVMTRKRRAHIWIIRPKNGKARINSFELFPFLLSGRKSRFFARLRLPKISHEWEIEI